jgi:predicted transcriptional regulator
MLASTHQNAGVATVTDVKTLTVKVPIELHTRLQALATADMRSMHAEILWLLRDGVARREAQDATGRKA